MREKIIDGKPFICCAIVYDDKIAKLIADGLRQKGYYARKLKISKGYKIWVSKNPRWFYKMGKEHDYKGVRKRNLKGQIKNRIQIFNPRTKRWVKIDTTTGKIIAHKSDSKPFKRVRKYNFAVRKRKEDLEVKND